MQNSIAIVGCGLGGLATANALQKYGFDVQIFEQSPVLGEVGGGIQVSPQAIKILTASGIDRARLIASGVPSQGIFTRDMNTGEEFCYFDWRNAETEYGAPFISCHRADIHKVLSDGIPGERIHLGHKLRAVDEHDDHAVLHFENGVSHKAGIVIGADGIHSIVRNQLYGDDSPKFTGQMVWRALIPASQVDPAILEPSGHIRWVGAGRQFYAYYLRDKEIVSIVTQQESEAWVSEGWTLEGDPEEMRRSFPDPEPRLAKLLSLVTKCNKLGVFLREPTENWGRGRIQLIGDAAHAMLPNAGQGACQAFEDGYALARWLEANPDPVAAFEGFRRARMPRVHAIQRRSALNASAKRLDTAAERKAAFSDAGVAAANAVKWIYAYDAVENWQHSGEVETI